MRPASPRIHPLPPPYGRDESSSTQSVRSVVCVSPVPTGWVSRSTGTQPVGTGDTQITDLTQSLSPHRTVRLSCGLHRCRSLYEPNPPVLLARRDFAHWTNISADFSPVGEAPSWLATKHESSPERLLGVDHPHCPQQTTRAPSVFHGIRTLDLPPG